MDIVAKTVKTNQTNHIDRQADSLPIHPSRQFLGPVPLLSAFWAQSNDLTGERLTAMREKLFSKKLFNKRFDHNLASRQANSDPLFKLKFQQRNYICSYVNHQGIPSGGGPSNVHTYAEKDPYSDMRRDSANNARIRRLPTTATPLCGVISGFGLSTAYSSDERVLRLD